MIRACLLALFLLHPATSRAGADDDLRRARDTFEWGDYEEAGAIAEDLLRRNVLSSDEQLIDANRIAALSALYGDAPDRREKAERYFLQILSIEPDYRLDPFFTTPAAVEFYYAVRRDNEERLAPIREQRRLAKEARRAEEEARARFLEERARAAQEASAEPEVLERRHLALVFLPLGAGQFQNGDRSAGLTLATIQATAALTSAASFLAIQSMTTDGRIARQDLELARNLDTVKWASAAIFYFAWGYGVVDAWSRFEPEVTRPRQRKAPAHSEPPAARGEEETALLPVPLVSAGTGGATVGVAFRF